MDREHIFTLALRLFNIDYSKIEGGSEIEICNEFIDTAEEFCINAAQWTFMMKSHSFTSSERVSGSFLNLKHGYQLPSDLFTVSFVNGEYNADFAIRGQEIFFFSENPTIDYISRTIDYESFPYPTTFAHLIASQLALKIAPMIAPDSNLENRIAQQYAIYFQSLQAYNLSNRRIQQPRAIDLVPPHGDNRFHPEAYS